MGQLLKNADQLIDALRTHHLIDTECRLEKLQTNYAELYDLAPIGYFTIGSHGLILEVNAAGADLLNINKHTLINRAFTRYVAPEFQHVFSEYHHSAFKESVLKHCQLKLLKKDGPLFYAKLVGKVINDSKLLMMVIDVTHHKDTDQNLRSNNPPNELFSAITNELNNPLGVMANYIHGCMRRLESGSYQVDDILEGLKKTSDQLNRVHDLILRMKNFILKGDLDFQLTCIDSLINEAISTLKDEFYDFPVAIHYQKNKYITQACFDKCHVQHVILNLARNSIEAMKDAGISEPLLRIEVNQVHKDTLEVCMLDNGPGFSQENSYQLFNPSFSTKPYGTGLGLAISRTIIEAHGGKLFGNLNDRQGACFKFTLPINRF